VLHNAVDQRETSSLIGSDKVEGTLVCRLNGDNIGTIERVMIDKLSGKVAYAVMSFGGFLGIGEDYYPLPWSVLTYNPSLGGYEVDLTEQQLRNAPKYPGTRVGIGPIANEHRSSPTTMGG
jgi:PRC-barrel domain